MSDRLMWRYGFVTGFILALLGRKLLFTLNRALVEHREEKERDNSENGCDDSRKFLLVVVQGDSEFIDWFVYENDPENLDPAVHPTPYLGGKSATTESAIMEAKMALQAWANTQRVRPNLEIAVEVRKSDATMISGDDIQP